MPIVTRRVTDGPLTADQLSYLGNLREAVGRHQQLLEKSALSLPSHLGQLVITVSSAVDKTKISRAQQTVLFEAFMLEAQQLQEQRERAGLHAAVVIRERAMVHQISLDLADPEVSDMIFIGEGNISRLRCDSRGTDSDMGWMAVSKSTAHLKQGKFEQRMCGHYPYLRFVEAPFGTFAVSQLSNLTAAVGVLVPDIGPSDDLFRPVFRDGADLYRQIVDLDAAYPRRV